VEPKLRNPLLKKVEQKLLNLLNPLLKKVEQKLLNLLLKSGAKSTKSTFKKWS